MSRIFVSYRRKDSDLAAGRLADNLADIFGAEDVFRDVRIEGGEDFGQAIERELDSCAALIAVIGENWEGIRNENKRRIDEPDDWVHLEVSRALARGIRVIPVLINASMPSDEALPADLQRLSKLQALEFTDRHWKEDVNGLAAILEKIPGITRRNRFQTTPVPSRATPDQRALSTFSTIAALWLAIAVLIAAILVASRRAGEPEQSPYIVFMCVPLLIGCVAGFFWEIRAARRRPPVPANDLARPAVVMEISNGLLAGIAGGVCTGVAISIPYYQILQSALALDSDETAASVILEITVFTSMVGAALGVIYNGVSIFFQDPSRRRQKNWLWNEASAATLGAGAAGIVFGVIGGYYFGQKDRPVVDSTPVIVGGLIGVGALNLILMSSRDRRLRWTNLGAALLSALPPLVIGAFITALLYGAGISFEDFAEIFQEMERWGMIVGGVIYGVAVGAILGMGVGLAALISRLDRTRRLE